MARKATSNSDRRNRYTKKVISEAVADLLDKKPIDKITVTEICKMAEINRGTFYLHYNTPHDVLHEMEDEVYEQLIDFSQQSLADESKRAFITDSMMNMYQSDKVLRAITYGSGFSPRLYTKVCDYGQKMFAEMCKATGLLSEWESELYATFLVNGCMAVSKRRDELGYINYKEELRFIDRVMEAMHRSVGLSPEVLNDVFLKIEEQSITIEDCDTTLE